LRRLLLSVIAILSAILLFLLIKKRNAPPQVPFAKVIRETVVSTLSTNGKVEPIEWASARAEMQGLVEKVFVEKGQRVTQGAPLVQLDARQPKADLEAAEAKASQAQAELATLRQGGRSSDVAALDASLAAARQELGAARQNYESLHRLEQKSAATAYDVTTARQHVDQIQLQIQGLVARRAALVSQPDLTAAEARLREAQASVKSAQDRIALTLIRAPIDGIVYQLDPKAGSYVNPGDLIANIGKLDRVRVKVYVDEPDLGRVGVGMPVTITWDAFPGRKWKGTVEKMATEVVALGTRQVGEVSCAIENPDHDLLPGTNITAEITSKVAPHVLAIPKAAVRRMGGHTGVFVLNGDRIEWKNVELGISNPSNTEVNGLKDGDSVALPTERKLKNGMEVTAVYP
jgi:HlyD family secretion protein